MKPLYRDSGNSTSLCVYKISGKWYDFSAGYGGEFNDLLKLMGQKGIDPTLIEQNYQEEELDFKIFNPSIVIISF